MYLTTRMDMKRIREDKLMYLIARMMMMDGNIQVLLRSSLPQDFPKSTCLDMKKVVYRELIDFPKFSGLDMKKVMYREFVGFSKIHLHWTWRKLCLEICGLDLSWINNIYDSYSCDLQLHRESLTMHGFRRSAQIPCVLQTLI